LDKDMYQSFEKMNRAFKTKLEEVTMNS
jgi:hypothetical protein